MSLRRIASAVAAASVVCVVSCGARSGLSDCLTDSDCKQRDLCATLRCIARECVVMARTVCEDNDPCTDDRCDKKTGSCVFDHQTVDLDGDGHRGPKPGLEPSIAACGDDCDDTDSNAFPGNAEVCDGVDNDCNGTIDDGADYVPLGIGNEVRVSVPEDDYAETGWLTRGGSDRTLALYLGTRNAQLDPFSVMLDDTGKADAPPKIVGSMPAAAGSAVAAWTGDRYGVVWSDRRDGNYEIYFSTFDAKGAKLPPGDIRVTVSEGFSIYPTIAWTGQQFVIAWQEERDGVDGWRLQAQVLGLDGRLIGNIIDLTPGGTFEQAPVMAASKTEIGLAWVRGNTASQHIVFGTFAFGTLAPKSTPQDISGARGGRTASLVVVKDTYVAAWYAPDPTMRTVFATALSKNGTMVVPARRVPDAAVGQSRDPALLSLGDRVVVVWADNRDTNQGFELYSRILASDLTNLGPQRRITNALGDSVAPVVSFGHHGSVSILFRDDRLASPAAFFTTLSCMK
jgi:hypothetical protein